MASESDLRVTFEIVDSMRLKAHEEVVEDHVRIVMAGLRKLGHLKEPVIADRATGVILDGHHRHEALRRMGYARVPVAFVDYLDPRIRVEAWREAEKPPTKAEVIALAQAGRRYAPKTTRHRFPRPVGEFLVELAELR